MRFAAVKVGVAALVLSLLPAHLYAAGTQINLAVCGQGSGSTITIASPVGDSVINTSDVTVSGSVENATQIDVSIDNAYSQTEPLSPADTSYSFSVQVSPGTHTIDLVANDVCQNRSGSATVVITFERQAAPSPGGSVPTDVGNGGEPGVRVNPANPKAPDSSPSVLTPVVNIAKDITTTVAHSVDAVPTPGESTGGMARRMILASAGLAIMLLGPIGQSWLLLRNAMNYLALRGAHIKALLPPRPTRKMRLIFRAIGLLVFGLSLTL